MTSAAETFSNPAPFQRIKKVFGRVAVAKSTEVAKKNDFMSARDFYKLESKVSGYLGSPDVAIRQWRLPNSDHRITETATRLKEGDSVVIGKIEVPIYGKWELHELHAHMLDTPEEGVVITALDVLSGDVDPAAGTALESYLARIHADEAHS